MTAEERELAGLVGLAWERRAEDDFGECVAAIIDWFDRRHVRALESRRRQLDYLKQLMRETPAERELRAEREARDFVGEEPAEWIGPELPPEHEGQAA